MSMTGIIVILVAALILFGPEELPRIARSVGKFVGQAQRIYKGYTKEFRDILEEPIKDITHSINHSLDVSSVIDAVADNKSSADSSGANGAEQSDDAGLSADKMDKELEADPTDTLLRYEDTDQEKEAAKAANPLHDLPEELVQDKQNKT